MIGKYQQKGLSWTNLWMSCTIWHLEPVRWPEAPALVNLSGLRNASKRGQGLKIDHNTSLHAVARERINKLSEQSRDFDSNTDTH